MHIFASALIIGASFMGAHYPAPHHASRIDCAEDAIELRIDRAGRHATCIPLEYMALDMHDAASSLLRTYGAHHAFIMIDDDDGEIVGGRK